MNFWNKVKRFIDTHRSEDVETWEDDIAVDISTDLTPTQQEVYNAVRREPGATARELGLKYFPEDWRIPGRRLKELADKGLIEVGTKRRNTDTQIEVFTYFPIRSMFDIPVKIVDNGGVESSKTTYTTLGEIRNAPVQGTIR